MPKKKGPNKKVDMSKIECYHCYKMRHYMSDFLDNHRSKKIEKYHSNMAKETAPPKKAKPEEDFWDLHYQALSLLYFICIFYVVLV